MVNASITKHLSKTNSGFNSNLKFFFNKKVFILLNNRIF